MSEKRWIVWLHDPALQHEVVVHDQYGAVMGRTPMGTWFAPFGRQRTLAEACDALAIAKEHPHLSDRLIAVILPDDTHPMEYLRNERLDTGVHDGVPLNAGGVNHRQPAGESVGESVEDVEKEVSDAAATSGGCTGILTFRRVYRDRDSEPGTWGVALVTDDTPEGEDTRWVDVRLIEKWQAAERRAEQARAEACDLRFRIRKAFRNPPTTYLLDTDG